MGCGSYESNETVEADVWADDYGNYDDGEELDFEELLRAYLQPAIPADVVAEARSLVNDDFWGSATSEKLTSIEDAFVVANQLRQGADDETVSVSGYDLALTGRIIALLGAALEGYVLRYDGVTV